MNLKSTIGDRLYRMGDHGDVVRAIQVGLRGLGFALNGTGYFGPATDTAVETFQKRAGLTVDGVVGSKTASAIDAAGTANDGKSLLIQTPAGKPNVVVPHAEVARPLWVEAGMKLLGTREGAGSLDNPVIIEWAKEEGGEIAASYKHDSIPWCALFANHILTKVGLKGTETLWALDFAGNWPAVRLSGPCVGAFAPMKRPGGGHITIIVGKDQNGLPMGLGGNQRDAVTIEPFAKSRLNEGFWWPKGVPVPNAQGYDHLPRIRSDGRVSTNEA